MKRFPEEIRTPWIFADKFLYSIARMGDIAPSPSAYPYFAEKFG
jgi:hypothetical protein